MRSYVSPPLTVRNESCVLMEVEGSRDHEWRQGTTSFRCFKTREIAGGGSRCTLGSLRRMKGLRVCEFCVSSGDEKIKEKKHQVDLGLIREYENL